ncbi:MAG: phosphotriesterase [Deinococcota bacterium]
MSIICTVLDDIRPAELGFTLGHEHLIGQPPKEFAEDDLTLDSEDAAIRELDSLGKAGGRALIEMSTVDYARDAYALARISEAANIHIIAATGFNKAKFADRYSSTLSEDELTQWMIQEVTVGITEPPRFVSDTQQTPQQAVRAGLLKGATSLNGPTEAEQKVLRAVARAHQATGAPVSTHTEKATWALEQATFLIDHGVNANKLLIGHLDFRPDLDYLAEVASLGVYIGLDQFGKAKYLADEARVDLVVGLLERGYSNVLLSGDMARHSYWQVFGGPGLAHIPTKIVPMLKDAGVGEETLEHLFIHNPCNLLQFTPAT